MIRKLQLTFPMLLAACQQQPQPSVDAQDQSRAERVAQGEDPDTLKPGKWETKQEIEGVAKADLNARSKAEIRNSTAAIDQCLAPDEAHRPDANFFAGGDASACEYNRFSMHGGLLEAGISCTVTPGTMTMTLKGRYTPTSYALDATATTSGTGDSPITTSAKLTGTWLEACPDPASQRSPEAAAH